MFPLFHTPAPGAFDALPPRDVAALLATARSLQRAAEAGRAQPLLLRGKNLALMCETDDQADAALLRSAASELGARVSIVRTPPDRLGTPQELQHTARMLGQLYDAVACQGMAPELVRQIAAEAGVPVYDDIASPEHPTARLAEMLAAGSAPDALRRFVLQAVLLSTLA